MTGRYRYTFTGPARLTDAELAVARETVAGLLLPAEVTTGACTGWDMAVARAAVELWPDAHHRVIVPAADHDAEGLAGLRVAALLARTALEVVRLPPGSREPYRARNEVMIRGHGDVLIAALRRPWYYRSGEWMTVRIAGRAGVPVEVVDLSAVPA